MLRIRLRIAPRTLSCTISYTMCARLCVPDDQLVVSLDRLVVSLDRLVSIVWLVCNPNHIGWLGMRLLHSIQPRTRLRSFTSTDLKQRQNLPFQESHSICQKGGAQWILDYKSQTNPGPKSQIHLLCRHQGTQTYHLTLKSTIKHSQNSYNAFHRSRALRNCAIPGTRADC